MHAITANGGEKMPRIEVRTIKTVFTRLFTCLAAYKIADVPWQGPNTSKPSQTEMGRANYRDVELWLLEQGEFTHTAIESKTRKQYQVCLYRKADT